MASALELGKLVMASYLYRWWKNTPKLLKTYSIAAVAILMVITSIGIYGYLSAAYASVAATPQNTLNQITALDARQSSLNSTINRLERDNTNIEARQTQAQASLDNVLAGETELSQRSAFANLRQEIADLDTERNANNERIEAAVTERDSLENVKVGLNAELNTNSDIGPFIYVARTTGLPLDTVVKWFVLMIVFVFDPLAISLILAYNNIVVKEQKGLKGEHDPGMEIFKKWKPKINLTRRDLENDEDEKDEAYDFSNAQPNPYTKPELAESDVIDLDALRTLDSLKEIRDLSDQSRFADEWEEDEEDLSKKFFDDESADGSRDSAPENDEELLEIYDGPMDKETAEKIKSWGEPIEKGWSLTRPDGFPNDMPFWERPGYDWERREKEWKRFPAAVEFRNKMLEDLTEEEE